MRTARRQLLKRSLGLSALWTTHASGYSLNEIVSTRSAAMAAQTETPGAATSEIVAPAGYLAPYQRGPDSSGVACLDHQGLLLSELELPGRAHGVTVDPARRSGCVFARRPGNFFVVIDLQRKRIVRQIMAPAGRHFYGHGTFSSNGAYLFATENDYDAQAGVIGIYEVAKGFKRLREFRSGGIGPHDILRLAQTDSLLVANGGIATHPETGRRKLNLDCMQPSVSLIDARTGRSLSDFALPERLHRISLRHLACDTSGVCWVAGQQQPDPATDATPDDDQNGESTLLARTPALPLLARLDLSRATPRLHIVELPADVVASLHGYVSSIAVNGDSVMLTSARGGVVVSVDARSGELISSIALSDCSGVAAAREPDAFIVTSGRGEWVHSDSKGHSPIGHSVNQWDNHLGQI